MKIAICLSGFIRTWKYTKDNFKHILCNGQTPDLFIHTYKQNFYEYSAGKQDVVYTYDEIKEMFSEFNLIELVVEDRDVEFPKMLVEGEKFKDCSNYLFMINESSGNNAKTVPVGARIIDQLRKIELCNKLKSQHEEKTGVVYDVVLRSRMDILYFQTPNWNNIIENNIYTETGTTGGFPHDCVTYGTSKTMDIFCRRYSELESLLFANVIPGGDCQCGNILPCCALCAHTTFRHILLKYNIRLISGTISAIIQRSDDKFLIVYQGTKSLSEVDISTRNHLLFNMFPGKIYFAEQKPNFDGYINLEFRNIEDIETIILHKQNNNQNQTKLLVNYYSKDLLYDDIYTILQHADVVIINSI